MIKGIKQFGLFRVDIFGVGLDLPHKEIALYCLEVIDSAEGYTSYFDREFNKGFKDNFPHKEQFEKDLCDAADTFVAKTGRTPFAERGGHALNYWCSVYQEHDQHGSHIHPQSLISGTYYPQSAPDSAGLTLEAPWISRLMHDSLALKLAVHEYYPKPGECLMWPAWLDHRVGRQGKTDTPRIAISFNIDYKNAKPIEDG